MVPCTFFAGCPRTDAPQTLSLQMNGHGLRLTCQQLSSSMVQTQMRHLPTWDLALMLMMTMTTARNPLSLWMVQGMRTPDSARQVCPV